MTEPLQIAPGPIYQRQEPVRDPAYLKFIRLLPCIACGKHRWHMEAMHTGPRGLGQKASDLDALPGCSKCHRELHAIGPVKFQELHRLDFAALRAMFRSFYQTKLSRKCPKIECKPECGTKERAA
jgi:hypothetical protein